MADSTPEQLAPLEAILNAHPAIQAFAKSPNKTAMGWMRALATAARETGVELPHDYQPTLVNGQVALKKLSFLQRNEWIKAAIAVGAPIAAGAAIGAVGAAGAASAGGAAGVGETGAVTGLAGSGLTAGGVGIGETGAVTGLAGSGLGTGATLTGGTGTGILSAYDNYAKTAGKVGELATGISQSQQAGRRQDDLADMYAASQNNRALVDAATFNRDLPMTRAQQTARGDLMSSPMQDSAVTGSGRNVQISGGVRPSSFSASTTQAGDELKRQALLKLMDPEADKLTPQITTPRKPGALETGSGIVGTGLGILNAYNTYRGGG